MRRAVPFVGAFQAVNHLAAAGQDISAGALQRRDRRLLVDAQDQRVFRRLQVEADNIGGPLFGPGAGLVANCGSVLRHHERRRRNWTPSRRSRRQTASSEAPGAAAREAPSQLANPLGGGNSSWRRTRRRNTAPYLRVLPGRARSRSPASPVAAKRLRRRPTLFGRTPNSRPTASFRLPSRQARTILARSTGRASSVRLRAS